MVRSLLSLGSLLLLAAVLASGLTGGCADSGVEYSENAFLLPATLEDALPLAEALAREWNERAYLYGLGGGYTVTDTTGRGRTLSYRFYSTQMHRRLNVHLFAGTPWLEDEYHWPPPTQMSAVPREVDSEEAVRVAVDVAEELHLDVPSLLCPKLLSYPVWPEVIGGTSQVTDSVAWRVDFIEKRYFPGYEDSVAWSIARVYVHVVSGDTLGVIFGHPIPYPNP